MKITRDEIATASSKAVTEAKENGTCLYFGSGFEAGVRYAESKSQKSDSLPCVSHWVAASEGEPDLGEVIEYYDPDPLEGMMDRGITTYMGILPSGATHWRISNPPCD